eukprot:3921866-Prymnesium_polylepis.1
MEARQLALALQAEDARRAALQVDMERQAAEGDEFLTTGLSQSMSLEAFEAEYDIGDEIGRGVRAARRQSVLPSFRRPHAGPRLRRPSRACGMR